MNDLKELREYATNPEWKGELSRSERETILNVASINSVRTVEDFRYDPFFSYGSESHRLWRVVMVDGSRKTLDITEGGNTDGLWFIMRVQ